MISSQRMAAVDANAAALGVSSARLMESAGSALAREVLAVSDPGDTVALLCGRGNNGGDAFVAARHLTDRDVVVHLLGRPTTIHTTVARENWDVLEASEIPTNVVTDSADFAVGSPDVVVDALLGTGADGAPREPVRTAVERIDDWRASAGANGTVVAVDVPTGIDADTGDPTGDADGVAVDADRIVTFHDEKPGLASLDATVTVASIGIPAAATRCTGPGTLLGLGRDPDSHKGDNGAVLVVGGGPYAGAPTLTARAALRAGADLAHVACPAEVADTVQGFSQNLIVHPLSGSTLDSAHTSQLTSLATGVDAVVIGPGLGDAPATAEAVATFLAEYDRRVVVDADALRAVPDVDTDAEVICTPHQGELREMGGETAADPVERARLVRAFAAELGHTLLVKGRQDVIAGVPAEPGHDGSVVTRRNRTGNPGMTVGGTGDVLAGVVGALTTRTTPFVAAAAGAYVNGLAGDAAAEANGHGLVATDLIDRLPQALYDE